MKCVFCGADCEEWWGGHGYGNNPAPFPTGVEDRCCDWCNGNLVVPLRLRRMKLSGGGW